MCNAEKCGQSQTGPSCMTFTLEGRLCPYCSTLQSASHPLYCPDCLLLDSYYFLWMGDWVCSCHCKDMTEGHVALKIVLRK